MVLVGLNGGSVMDEVWNSYNVTFVFDYVTISTTVMALHEDAAPELAADTIYKDIGFSELSSFLAGAEDVVVELIDENVGMGMK
jgi:hypothetical protein